MLSKNNSKTIVISKKPLLHLKYWNDEGWFVGQLKEKPNVLSQAKTLNELIENVTECYCDLLKYEIKKNYTLLCIICKRPTVNYDSELCTKCKQKRMSFIKRRMLYIKKEYMCQYNDKGITFDTLLEEITFRYFPIS